MYSQFHMEMSLISKTMKVQLNSFPYERLCTKTRFEKEGNGNSEMAYFTGEPVRVVVHRLVCLGILFTG